MYPVCKRVLGTMQTAKMELACMTKGNRQGKNYRVGTSTPLAVIEEILGPLLSRQMIPRPRATSARTCAARSSSARLCVAVTMVRSRALPSGTVG